MQEVLQADWHEFAHSLQPGLQRLFLMFVLLIVFMCFMSNPPIKKYTVVIIAQFSMVIKLLFSHSKMQLSHFLIII